MSVGAHHVHPRVLREAADVAAQLLSIAFEWSWLSGEVPRDCRKGSIAPNLQERKTQETTGL